MSPYERLNTPDCRLCCSEHYGPRKASFRVQAFLELTVGKERLAKARSLARVAWT